MKKIWIQFARVLTEEGLTNIPSSPWDGAKTKNDMKQKMGDIMRELVCTLGLHLLENLALLLPLCYLWFKVYSRHTILAQSIGVTDIEIESFTNCTSIFSCSIGIALISPMLQLACFWFFMTKGSIWSSLCQGSLCSSLCSSKKPSAEAGKDIEMEELVNEISI